MAVEARHLNLFPPQILYNRDMMLNGIECMNNSYGGGMMYDIVSSAVPMSEMMFPMYGTMRAESGLTTAHLPVLSRKRSREDSDNSINTNQLLTYPTALQNTSSATQFSFLGQDFSSQIQRQQLELDSFIAHHSEKVRLEIEEKRKSYTRRVMAEVEEGMRKRLKAKEDEIEKMVKLNWALEERVKSVCVENQIWRNLAESNEATANVLRKNLEMVLAQVQEENGSGGVENAESCCGSSNSSSNENEEEEEEEEAAAESHNHDGVRLCRSCRKEEACVLLLPCRHLCLCSACGSSVHICPLCKSTQNCTLHVNFTSSST